MFATLQTVKNEKKVSSQGNDYIRCSIKVAGKWYSGFGDENTLQWQPGQQVEVDLFQEEYNGKMYGKFAILPPNPLEERIAHLEKALNQVIKFLKEKYPEIGRPKSMLREEKNDTVKSAEDTFGVKAEPMETKKESDDDLPWE